MHWIQGNYTFFVIILSSDFRCWRGAEYMTPSYAGMWIILSWRLSRSSWLKKNFSVHFSGSIVSNSLWPHGLQHARLSSPSPTPRTYSNSCPLSRWWHPTISFSIIPFSSCLQSFLQSGSFPISQFFLSGGQNIGGSASASVLPMNIQDWFPLR